MKSRVQTPERIEALRRAVMENPGLDTETLCTFVMGVHQSSVYGMLIKLEQEGAIYRRRPSTRIVWLPCEGSGLEVLLRKYAPKPDESKVVGSRHVPLGQVPTNRDGMQHAQHGAQSSLNGSSYHVAPRSVGKRHGGSD